MSQENVEIVRRGTALLNEGNWDVLFEPYRHDVEFCDLRSAVDTPEVLKGVEAVHGGGPRSHGVGGYAMSQESS